MFPTPIHGQEYRRYHCSTIAPIPGHPLSLSSEDGAIHVVQPRASSPAAHGPTSVLHKRRIHVTSPGHPAVSAHPILHRFLPSYPLVTLPRHPFSCFHRNTLRLPRGRRSTNDLQKRRCYRSDKQWCGRRWHRLGWHITSLPASRSGDGPCGGSL